jgi:hypothetical protein
MLIIAKPHVMKLREASLVSGLLVGCDYAAPPAMEGMSMISSPSWKA